MTSDVNKDKIVASASQMARWRRQVDTVVEKLSVDGFSAGNAVPIVYSTTEQKDHSIGKFGRMIQVDDGFQFRAGPLAQDNPVLYDFPKASDVSIGSAIAKGDWMPDLKDLMSELPDPIPKRKQNLTARVASIEERLFADIKRRYGSLVLFNPSFMTLKCARAYKPIIFLSDERWLTETYKWCDELGIKPDVEIGYPDSFAYAGTSPPVQELARYCRLMMNPYSAWSYHEQVLFGENEDGLTITCKKNDRTVADFLKNIPDCYVYSPQVVDRAYGGSLSAFLLSSEPLGLPHHESDVMPHAPWYIPEIREYKNEVICGHLEQVSKDGERYIDIKGEGTYLSRRGRYEAKGCVFVPFSHTGIPITRYTHGLHDRPCHQIRRIQNATYHVYSDEPIVMARYKVKSNTEGTWTVDPQIVEDSNRYVISPDGDREIIEVPADQVSMNGVAYAPDRSGLYVLAGFGRGFMHKLAVYRDVPGRRVLVDAHIGYGHWTVFPTPNDFRKYRWVIAVGTVSWNNFLTAHPRDDTYQSKARLGYQALMQSKITSKVWETWDEHGVTIKDFADCWEHPPSDAGIARALHNMPNICSAGDGWIDLSVQSQLSFLGEKGELPCVNGWSVAEVFDYLRSQDEITTIESSDTVHMDMFFKWMSCLPFDARRTYKGYSFRCTEY